MNKKMQKALSLIISAATIGGMGASAALVADATTAVEVTPKSGVYVASDGTITDKAGNVFKLLNAGTNEIALVRIGDPSNEGKNTSWGKNYVVPDVVTGGGKTFKVVQVGTGSSIAPKYGSKTVNAGYTSITLPNSIKTVEAKAFDSNVLGENAVITLGSDKNFRGLAFQSFASDAFVNYDTSKLTIQTYKLNVNTTFNKTYGYLYSLPKNCTFKSHFLSKTFFLLDAMVTKETDFSGLKWEPVESINFGAGVKTDAQGYKFYYGISPVGANMTDTRLPNICVSATGTGGDFRVLTLSSENVKKYFKKTADFDDCSITLTPRDSKVASGSQTVTGLDKAIDITPKAILDKDGKEIGKTSFVYLPSTVSYTSGSYKISDEKSCNSAIIVKQDKCNVIVPHSCMTWTYTNNSAPGISTVTATTDTSKTSLYSGSTSAKFSLINESAATTDKTAISVNETDGEQKVSIKYNSDYYYIVDYKPIGTTSTKYVTLWNGVTQNKKGYNPDYDIKSAKVPSNYASLVRVRTYSARATSALVDSSYTIIHPESIMVQHNEINSSGASVVKYNTLMKPIVRVYKSFRITYFAKDIKNSDGSANTDQKYYISIYKSNNGEAPVIDTNKQLMTAHTGYFSHAYYYDAKFADFDFTDDTYYAVVYDAAGKIVSKKMVSTQNTGSAVIKSGNTETTLFKVSTIQAQGPELKRINNNTGYVKNGDFMKYALNIKGTETKFDLNTLKIAIKYSGESDYTYFAASEIGTVENDAAFKKLSDGDKLARKVFVTADKKYLYVRADDLSDAYVRVEVCKDGTTTSYTSNPLRQYTGIATSFTNTSTLKVNGVAVPSTEDSTGKKAVIIGSTTGDKAGTNCKVLKTSVPVIGSSSSSALKLSIDVKDTCIQNGEAPTSVTYALYKYSSAADNGTYLDTGVATDATAIDSVTGGKQLPNMATNKTKSTTKVLLTASNLTDFKKNLQSTIDTYGAGNYLIVSRKTLINKQGKHAFNNITHHKAFPFKIVDVSAKPTISASSISSYSASAKTTVKITKLGGQTIKVPVAELKTWLSTHKMVAKIYDDNDVVVNTKNIDSNLCISNNVPNENYVILDSSGDYVTGFKYTYAPVFTSEKRKFKVVVTNTDGQKAENSTNVNFTVVANPSLRPLENTSTCSETVKLGQSIVMNGSSTGGSGNAKYKYEYRSVSDTVFTLNSDYSTNTSASVQPLPVGEFICRVTVKDSSNKEVYKEFHVVCTK